MFILTSKDNLPSLTKIIFSIISPCSTKISFLYALIGNNFLTISSTKLEFLKFLKKPNYL